MRSSAAALPVSPTPSPVPDLSYTNDLFAALGTSFIDSVPIPNNLFELATVILSSGLLFVSLGAFAFVLFLQVKSRSLHRLQKFNSLLVLRLLLILFASLWGINAILRQPFLHAKQGNHLSISKLLSQQENVCRIQLVVDLGIFEPGFLISLLFLVNSSINRDSWTEIKSLISISLICIPILLIQIFLVFFPPFEAQLPKFIHGSSVISTDVLGAKAVLCSYPFFSWAIFAVFSVTYSMAFMFSCWRVTALVINKGVRRRIYGLATSVVTALSVQIVSVAATWVLMPEEAIYAWVMLAAFFFVALCMFSGEILLVIKPIADALEVGGDHALELPVMAVKCQVGV